MFQQMHSQFVDCRKTFRTVLALVFPLAMMRANVFTNYRIFYKCALAVGTSKYTILIPVCLNVIFQHRTLAK